MKLSAENSRRTLTECFAHFGVPRAGNVRTWWSDRAPDGQVVITLWTDHFDAEMVRFSILGRRDLPKWRDRQPNRHRAELLKSVGVGGVFQSIIQRSADTTSHPRKTVERYIGPLMRLTNLNETTGEFSAEEVEGS